MEFGKRSSRKAKKQEVGKKGGVEAGRGEEETREAGK